MTGFSHEKQQILKTFSLFEQVGSRLTQRTCWKHGDHPKWPLEMFSQQYGLDEVPCLLWKDGS